MRVGHRMAGTQELGATTAKAAFEVGPAGGPKRRPNECSPKPVEVRQKSPVYLGQAKVCDML